MQTLRRCIFNVMCLFVVATTVLADTKPTTLALSTSAFIDEGMLPVRYTCDGDNHPPSMAWTGVPMRTKTVAIIMSDLTAPAAPNGVFYHWLLFNISPSATTI